MKYSFSIYTLGCKVSQYESEAILEEALRQGFVEQSCDEISDVYVINTCTVTAEGDRKCRQLIRRIIKNSPEAKVLICGCYSQISPEQIAQIEGVDYVCGTKDKLSVVRRAMQLLNGEDIPKIEVDSLSDAEFEKMNITKAPRTRAYVKIEDGCENHCAYCIIPSARGHVRSKSIADTLSEVIELAKGGVKEVVLTGIETASFGIDSGERLTDLLFEVNKIDGIERIRLGSLEPTIMRPEFIEEISKFEKLAPHFHLSMQSGCAKTLAEMRRKYNPQMALKNIENMRKAIPNVQFTTDFIVGFPNESDEDFEQTLEFAKKVKFLSTHVFKYSKRAGTPAATFENQVSEDVKHDRSKALISLSSESTKYILEQKIKTNPSETVLFEQKSKNLWCGHTPSFIEVRVISDENLHGKILPVTLLECRGDWIFARL